MKLTASILCVVVFAVASDARAQNVEVSRGQITVIQEVEVPAQETGVVGSIKVRPGQRVGAGELLGSLDETVAKLDLNRVAIEEAIARHRASSSIHVALAKKGHQVALAELRRGEEAVARYARALSGTEMDRLRYMAEQAELAIEQAHELQLIAKAELDLKRNEMDVAKRRVDRHRFVSPLIGVVADVNSEESEWVEIGTPVFRVLRLDRLQCEGYVSATQAPTLTVGQPVEIEVQLTEKKTMKVTGRLTYVSHEIDKFKKDVRVAAEFDNEKLVVRPGMPASMEILPAPSAAGR